MRWREPGILPWHRRPAFGFAVLVFVLSACALLVPPYDPNDYPCGPQGQLCVDEGGCCTLDEACGGAVGCPAGMCCYEGPADRADRDGGARYVRMRPETARR